ncbi:MAG: hypothetical protein DDT21_00759 [Syntrophomonadaceae bacterium]|nr:hypothetical protein [Bacillota bacterium]
MRIVLNGKETCWPEETEMLTFIRNCGFNQERVVVQHNGRILTREEWTGVSVQEDDRIDVLQFVGGG